MHLETRAAADALDDALSDDRSLQRIEKAFAKGSGQGLFWLGAREVEASLPPVLARWREFSRLFMQQLCQLSDDDANKSYFEVPWPEEECQRWLQSAPLMTGADYLTEAALHGLWREMVTAFHREKATFVGGLQTFLQHLHPYWNQVGRVYLHLAENKQRPEMPFAFMATYVPAVAHSVGGTRLRHIPLSQALTEYSGAKNSFALLSLLRPLQKAASQSVWLKEMVDSGEIYQPLAWTPADAYRFLQDIPAFEASGLLVRVPNWWQANHPPRPRVRVTLGEKKKSVLGMDALLDFNATLTLEGEVLSEQEWNQLMQSTEKLVVIKGKWVEIDREKLQEVLDHWKTVQRSARKGEISFLEGMRLLAGAPLGAIDSQAETGSSLASWTEVIAGSGIAETLRALRSPETLALAGAVQGLNAVLRPYQKEGVQWLRLLNRLRLGACLADDMGLGKTVQVLALFLDLKAQTLSLPHLLVVPASLIGNWTSEIERFAPSLKWRVAHPSAMAPGELARGSTSLLAGVDVVITTYGTLLRSPWLCETSWGLVVLDEAQAIKNPNAKQTKAVKSLKSSHRLALTGTPIENHLSDLWSLFDFLCPGLLGTAPAFSRYAKRLAAGKAPSFGPLRQLVKPYILRRLKSDKRVIADLPDKTEVAAFCGLSKTQAALYQQSVDSLTEQLGRVDGIQRKGVVLAFLTRFKQICNHPSQWLGDGTYAPDESGKFLRLQELVEPIAAKQEKVLLFTQFREMTHPLSTFLARCFGKPGLLLHGGTPVGERKELVRAFQEDDQAPFFVLSLKAGGTGLNLTQASHVIHFDRWWNPAVENQATDRAYRIGQKRNVLVHKFVCQGTIEEKIDAMIASKVSLSKDLLEGSSEAVLTQMSNEELLQTVSLDLNRALTAGEATA